MSVVDISAIHKRADAHSMATQLRTLADRLDRGEAVDLALVTVDLKTARMIPQDMDPDALDDAGQCFRYFPWDMESTVLLHDSDSPPDGMMARYCTMGEGMRSLAEQFVSGPAFLMDILMGADHD